MMMNYDEMLVTFTVIGWVGAFSMLFNSIFKEKKKEETHTFVAPYVVVRCSIEKGVSEYETNLLVDDLWDKFQPDQMYANRYGEFHLFFKMRMFDVCFEEEMFEEWEEILTNNLSLKDNDEYDLNVKACDSKDQLWDYIERANFATVKTFLNRNTPSKLRDNVLEQLVDFEQATHMNIVNYDEHLYGKWYKSLTFTQHRLFTTSSYQKGEYVSFAGFPLSENPEAAKDFVFDMLPDWIHGWQQTHAAILPVQTATTLTIEPKDIESYSDATLESSCDSDSSNTSDDDMPSLISDSSSDTSDNYDEDEWWCASCDNPITGGSGPIKRDNLGLCRECFLQDKRMQLQYNKSLKEYFNPLYNDQTGIEEHTVPVDEDEVRMINLSASEEEEDEELTAIVESVPCSATVYTWFPCADCDMQFAAPEKEPRDRCEECQNTKECLELLDGILEELDEM